MDVASQFEEEYWDGDRKFGYGGYSYDGRWEKIAKILIEKYSLGEHSKVVDLGCGMGHLIFELHKLCKCSVIGLDISKYAKENTLEDVRDKITTHDISETLPFKEKEFDLAISIMTLHNLELPELESCISEIVRISNNSYIAVESYRNNRELFNLQCWALTCHSFYSPRSWDWIFNKNNYIDREVEYLYFK
jgi:ubiquinone/menaquinone biosynthesis C-methylase UbiE